MNATYLELIYKGIISIGVAGAVYILKDFKADFRKLTDSLTAVTLSLQTLITKDTHKDEAISELKIRADKFHRCIHSLQTRVAILENNQNKENPE